MTTIQELRAAWKSAYDASHDAFMAWAQANCPHDGQARVRELQSITDAAWKAYRAAKREA